jgi:hypothetical protein
VTSAGGTPRRRAVRRRVVVEPGLAYETCDPAPTSEATRQALDDIARAAGRLLGGAQHVSAVSVTGICGEHRVWCHGCGKVRWLRSARSAHLVADQHRCAGEPGEQRPERP